MPVRPLSTIESLSTELLFEIFAHVPPKSLLYLSRTSLPLRNILLDMKSTSVWKKSIEHTYEGYFPSLIPKMDLPAFVHLLLSSSCSVGRVDNHVALLH